MNNKLTTLLVTAIMTVSYTAQATNYIKIINNTDQQLKVGLFKSFLNFSEMRVEAGMHRIYETGSDYSCLTKITLNGTTMWSGKKCENYDLTITKTSSGKFELFFKELPTPKPAANPNNDISF